MNINIMNIWYQNNFARATEKWNALVHLDFVVIKFKSKIKRCTRNIFLLETLSRSPQPVLKFEFWGAAAAAAVPRRLSKKTEAGKSF